MNIKDFQKLLILASVLTINQITEKEYREARMDILNDRVIGGVH